jgi:hypothetical protein
MYTPFKDIIPSTKTIIINTNLCIEKSIVVQNIHVKELNIEIGVKTKEELEIEVMKSDVKDGDIILVEYADIMKGLKFKRKRNNKKPFRNNMTFVMVNGDNFVNFKVPEIGKIQMTGCIYDHQAVECIKYFWDYLRKIPEGYSFTDSSTTLKCIFRTVMTNIDFGIGFNINREKLNEYFNLYTPYKSLLETSFAYTGVNVKFPYNIDGLEYDQIEWIDDKWVECKLPHPEYLTQITNQKELYREVNRKRRNTFLVFHSGTAIMTGMVQQFMEQHYNEFMNIVTNIRNNIIENHQPEPDLKKVVAYLKDIPDTWVSKQTISTDFDKKTANNIFKYCIRYVVHGIAVKKEKRVHYIKCLKNICKVPSEYLK